MAANTQIFAQAHLSYFDGTETLTATASVSVTVGLVATAPAVVTGTSQTAANANPATTLTDTFTIEAQSNGPDTYSLSAVVSSSTNTSGATATADSASITLGATVSTEGSTTTQINVPVDGASDDNINGIETGDTVVIGGESRTVQSLTDNTTGSSTVVLDTALSNVPAAGDLIAESKEVTVTVTPGAIISKGTNVTVMVQLNAASVSSSGATALSAETTNTFLSGSMSFNTYVRNITNPGGSGVSYSYQSVSYYSAGVTAKAGDVLEYLLVATNTGTGPVTAVVLSDDLATANVSLNTGAYSGSSDVLYVDEDGVISYLSADLDADAAVYSAPTLTVNAGAGAASSAGGTIAAGKTVLALYQVTVDTLSSGASILNSVQLTSDDVDPITTSVSVSGLLRTTAVLKLMNHAPQLPAEQELSIILGAYRSGSATGSFTALAAPVMVGAATAVDLTQPVPLNTATQLHQGDPLFISLTDQDQNLNSSTAETVEVAIRNDTAGDAEVVRLTETGVNTGVFSGYTPTISTSSSGSTTTLYNGVLSIGTQDNVIVRYVDSADGTDTTTQSMLVDPYGIVLDTSTGDPVSGATITLQTSAGAAATVFGDDGVSIFPSTITSGGTVSDSSGQSYSFPDGEYRFPYLSPGTYRLVVTPPDGYGFPSSVDTETIQALGSGTFAIVTGSRGEDFTISAGPAVRIDLPVDPRSSSLWIQKISSKDIAGHGDFIPYRITLTNSDTTSSATGVTVVDRLPSGLRLRKGSIRIDGSAGSNPAISSDGRTLSFMIGTLAAATSVKIDYVAEVTVGTPLGSAVNYAYAVDSAGDTSNTAKKAITIRDDFQRTRSVLMGRVMIPDGNDPAPGGKGVPGVRIYLEDGTFVLTDKGGRFHFEGVKKGLHVVQLDIDSLPEGYEPYALVENTRFAGRAFSQFVETQGGALWRADFYIRPKTEAGTGSTRDTLTGGATVDAAHHSAQSDNTSFKDNGEDIDGFVDANKQIDLVPVIVLFHHFSSLGVQLDEEDYKKLDEMAGKLGGLRVEKILVTGFSDNYPIAERSRDKYLSNKALSLARAKTVGHYLIDKLHVPPEQLYVTGKGEASPVSSNYTEEGRALNRRVEVRVMTRRTVKVPVGAVAARTKAPAQNKPEAAPGAAVEKPAQQKAKTASPAQGPTAGPETEITINEPQGILSQAEQDILTNPINGVRVCLDSSLRPRLFVDDVEVKADRIGFTMKDAKARKTIYSYVGVDFGPSGKHTLRLLGIGPFGNTRFQQEINIIRSGKIASIRLESADGNVADGKTPVKLMLSIHDADGTPIPAEMDLEIREGRLSPLGPPEKLSMMKHGAGKPRVHMNHEGEVLFKPVSTSGNYRLVLGYNDITVEVETYVQPKMRDWILVGLAEGTAGYNAVTGNMETLNDSGVDDYFYDDGRVAFYAKGQIKGKWLMTMAYDSAKQHSDTQSGLFQTINPDTYYTLYGDGTQQLYDAASSRKLYVKMEREHFYAMFGDFNTDMSITELSRYKRSLTGLKSEFQNKHFEINAFVSETDQVYIRDEIPGDGTSGIYHLSHKNLMSGTETVTIEVRDRYQSEIIISSTTKTRFTEYSIDYDSGTIIFQEPVYSKDEDFNPIIIVVEYECLNGGGEDYTYGGRAGVKLYENKLKAGATYIHEGLGYTDSNLYGADTAIKLDQATTLKAEIATSDYDDGIESRSGNAYLAQVIHKNDKADAKAYYRELEEGFGLGQQSGSETGTRKLGVEGTYRFTDNWDIKGNAYRHYNLETNALRDVAETRLNYSNKRRKAYVGLLHAQDQLDDDDDYVSNQLLLGGKMPTRYEKLSLTTDYAQSLGRNENSDYPTRVQLGAEYQAAKHVALIAAQEYTWGDEVETQDTRFGIRSDLWEGASMTSAVERQMEENEQRTLASAGLKQTWQLNKAWKVDAGMERSYTLSESYYFDTDASSYLADHEDFTSVSSGATYQVKQFIWDGRVEFRLAESENKWGFMSGVVKEIDYSKAVSGRARYFKTNCDDSADADTTEAELRLGLAYRPDESRWIVLDRLDYIIDEEQDMDTDYRSWRLINNVLANYYPHTNLEISLHYAAKYVLETIYENDYSGFTDFFGMEGRYDLNKRWDVGLHGSMFHSWHGGQFDYCQGASVGCNVVENAWISLGYNFTGFTDRDFSRSNFTAKGPFIRFRMKFDQNSVTQAAAWLKNSP